MNLIEIKNNFKGVFNIKEVIDYIDNITDIYEFTDKNISVIVYYNKHKDDIDFDFIRRVIKRGTTVIRTKPIKLILLLSSAKKILVDDKILTPYHANSGFTFIKRNEIFIFRKEEFPKVIIHELLHHDINIHSDDFKMENKELLMKHFNIHGKCKLIFLLCIIFFVEFRINQLFRSRSNVIATNNQHMRRLLRKIHRKKKKTHWLRGM